MKNSQINSEIKKVKDVMDSLMKCVKDKTISISERKKYYKEYLETSAYYLKLNNKKPNHNLTIV